MKSVMKLGVAIAVFFISFAGRANDAKLSVRVKEGAGKVVSFAVVDAKNVHVAIYAKDGAVLFDENLKGKEGKISRTYDLTAFPSGVYFLETETGVKVSRHQITIADKTATISETVAEVLKPVVANENGVLSVNIKGTETPVGIKMFDENNNELYAETFDGQSVAKKFDIKNTTARNITLVMSYNDKTFVETIAAR
ncbi:hypothetical protein AM493_16115 [Flavobacterium akiainvivens]|uniref:Secretion system C-terminal sorting domain-containing protein n=1 Tax=Flavobacterium akiainvivens TaxID=1202724 RepID=A0A0M9VJ59_9FLAO|nr:hypothetical protein [Flavobacterium akiainvivens]KOS07396.1 hypothetical protein AM493_16115 [Flavobacterium akiainvivens]SFQ47647.1 hypothetical protein SAMN05444144_105204 [Flavobacterium akiainvivens]